MGRHRSLEQRGTGTKYFKQRHRQLPARNGGFQGIGCNRDGLVWHRTIGACDFGRQLGQKIAHREDRAFSAAEWRERGAAATRSHGFA